MKGKYFISQLKEFPTIFPTRTTRHCSFDELRDKASAKQEAECGVANAQDRRPSNARNQSVVFIQQAVQMLSLWATSSQTQHLPTGHANKLNIHFHIPSE